MPRGKELEQLPIGNTAPGAGKDNGSFRRESLQSINRDVQPKPSLVRKRTDDNM